MPKPLNTARRIKPVLAQSEIRLPHAPQKIPTPKTSPQPKPKKSYSANIDLQTMIEPYDVYDDNDHDDHAPGQPGQHEHNDDQDHDDGPPADHLEIRRPLEATARPSGLLK